MMLSRRIFSKLHDAVRRRSVKLYSDKRTKMEKEYASLKEKVKDLPKQKEREQLIRPLAKEIFANNEHSLLHTSVYGFDYDYTLVSYSDELDKYTYNEGRSILVDRYKYPENIKHLDFNPHFAVRGLHYDVIKGLLMKVDAFHHIQMGTVYRGLTPLPDEEVIQLYGGDYIPKDYLVAGRNGGAKRTMIQLMDLFAIPEMNLLANVTDYFIRHDISFAAEYLYTDVKTTIQDLHKSGKLHRVIMDDIEKYLVRNDDVRELLVRLKKEGKHLFLVSNSGFDFIDAGLRFSVGDDWRELFDVVIVEARKPSFFTDTTRPFRVYNPETRSLSWGHVKKLERGVIYKEGNLSDLHELTGWKGRSVLYFGDHVYNDLVDPHNKLGWRTGAIIPELEHEIEVHYSADFQEAVRFLLGLEALLERWQSEKSHDCQALLHEWLSERTRLRHDTKILFNKQFGSRFRTFHNQSYFSQRLSLCADLYTSSVTNLLNYSTEHTFYPRRNRLPHEAV